MVHSLRCMFVRSTCLSEEPSQRNVHMSLSPIVSHPTSLWPSSSGAEPALHSLLGRLLHRLRPISCSACLPSETMLANRLHTDRGTPDDFWLLAVMRTTLVHSSTHFCSSPYHQMLLVRLAYRHDPYTPIFSKIRPALAKYHAALLHPASNYHHSLIRDSLSL